MSDPTNARIVQTWHRDGTPTYQLDRDSHWCVRIIQYVIVTWMDQSCTREKLCVRYNLVHDVPAGWQLDFFAKRAQEDIDAGHWCAHVRRHAQENVFNLYGVDAEKEYINEGRS